MKKDYEVLIFIIFVIFSCFFITLNHGGMTGDEKLLIDSSNEFASRLYKVLAAQSQSSTQGNFIFCPLCLSTGMALLSVGASGSTLTEIQNALGFPTNESTLLEGYGQIYQSISQNQFKANKLIFNGLFVTNKNIRIESTFQHQLKNYFQTVTRSTNSITNRQLKREIEGIINEGQETEDRDETDSTKRDEPAGDVTVHLQSKPKQMQGQGDEGNLVLANYLKFKAGWEKKFEVSSTTQEPFYVSKMDIITTSMMRQTGHFNIIRIPELDCRAISIPYLICDGFNMFKKSSAPVTKTSRSKPKRKMVCKSGVRDSRLQLIILLPNEIGGLSNLESKLTSNSLLEIPSKFEYKSYLDLSIPKFRFESTQDLINTTLMLNMETLSSSKSNFSRISQNESLRVSKIFHHVSFQVEEKGSQTKSSHLKGANPWTHPKIVKVDQPFLAFVHDKKLNAILIVMRVVRPMP